LVAWLLGSSGKLPSTTPLHGAALYNQRDIVIYLLKMGAECTKDGEEKYPDELTTRRDLLPRKNVR
jgi:ankyrin repeat protein